MYIMAIYWNARGYTKEEFIKAWSDSPSIAECARRLGLTIYGSTYRTLKLTARDLGLTSDHMTGQGWNTGKFNPSKTRPLEEVLIDNSDYGTSVLKKRLIKEGLIEYKCQAPFCPFKNQEKVIHPFTGELVDLKLSLDHKNGKNNDNRLENLRFLCQHCHSMTDTWCRGPRAASKKRRNPRNDTRLFVCECGGKKTRQAKVCRECSYKTRKGFIRPKKIDWPEPNELLQEVLESNYSKVSTRLGVSDNAVRKHLQRNGLTPPTGRDIIQYKKDAPQ